MNTKVALAVALALVAQCCVADVYMHNPRGANDRNCEKNVNRNNGNRLYDTQNNAKGGYACPRAVTGPNTAQPKTFYTAGSQMPIEWTNQHGCGANEKLNCEIIIQYACSDTLDPTQKFNSGNNVGTPRDGIPQDENDAATDRIPDNQANAVPDTTANRRFGMHESVDLYDTCQRVERNKGLFTADQRVNRNDARGTRQNPNGNRRGLECPQERDYYPHVMGPQPWVDVAVITSTYSAAKAQYYQTNSQNVATGTKGWCTAGATADAAADFQNAYNRRRVYNNKAACEAAGHVWQATAGHGATNTLSAAPEVIQGQFTRANQLGNSGGAITGTGSSSNAIPQGINSNRYIWTVPNHVNDNCVLRLRYNISTDDVKGFDPIQSSTAFTGAPGNTAAQNGASASPVTQDPYVTMGGAATDFLSLALNTNQYGRTFQDRSYVFEIKPADTSLPAGGKVYNLNARGKRGNIVQTYPAVEYDFTPNNIILNTGDGLHIQFAGSDYNPRRGCNDAEGGPPDGEANKNARADRMNMVFMDKLRENYPSDYTGTLTGASPFISSGTIQDKSKLMELAFLNQAANLAAQGKACSTQAELNAITKKDVRERVQTNCAKLNGQTFPYFDAGVMEVKAAGTFGYYSTRNNNFSNRSTKGKMCVQNSGTGACATVDTNANGDRAKSSSSAYQLANDVIPSATEDSILTEESSSDDPPENDANGDGVQVGCENPSLNSLLNIDLSAGQAVGVAIGGVAIGSIVAALVAYFVCRSGASGPKRVPTREGDNNWMNNSA